jgi:hypothetical protein
MDSESDVLVAVLPVCAPGFHFASSTSAMFAANCSRVAGAAHPSSLESVCAFSFLLAWNCATGTAQSITGSMFGSVWDSTGDRIGVHHSKHGHAFTAEDWTAMMDFFDKHLKK